MENKCKRCGRKLKNKNSISIGYGPSCAKAEGIINIKKKKEVVQKINYLSLDKF